MLRMVEFLRCLLFPSLLCAWPTAFAQEAGSDNPDYEKEIAAIEKELMEEISVWDYTTDLRLGGGYKENVTLSAFAVESSPFVAIGFDFMAIRIPLAEDGVEVTVFGALDDRRYLDAEAVDSEQSGLLNVSLEKSLAAHLAIAITSERRGRARRCVRRWRLRFLLRSFIRLPLGMQTTSR